MFDPFTDKELTNATANYRNNRTTLELVNIDNEMPYILKTEDNQESLRFYLMTDMKKNKKTASKTFFIENDDEPRNLSIEMDAPNFLHRFLSFILIRDKSNLRVNQFRYNYRRKKETISISINKTEKRMDLKLSSRFDYKSNTILDVHINGHQLKLELVFDIAGV